MASATATNNPNPPTGDVDKGENKFDLAKVKVDDLPEEVRDLVKGFQADYTKKTMALSDEKKEMDAKLKRADEWDQWYDRNKPTLEKYNEYAQKIAQGDNVHVDNQSQTQNPADDGGDDDPFTTEGDKQVKSDINQLRQDVNTGKQELVNTIQNNNKTLLALMEEIQTGDYPFKISPQKVIDYAQTEKIGDIKKAIKGAYQEELIDHEVKTKVEAKLEEERAKNVDVVNNTMPQGRVVRKVIKRGDK